MIEVAMMFLSMIKAAMVYFIMIKATMMFLSVIKAALQSWVTLSPNHPWLPLLLDQAGDGGGVDGKAEHEQTWQQVG